MRNTASLAMLLAIGLARGWAPAYAQDSCSIQNGSGDTLVDFLAYSPGGAAATGFGQITLNCTPAIMAGTVAYTLSVGPGQGSGGSFLPRAFFNGVDTLNYNLFVDAAHLMILGDGSPQTFTISGVCAGACPVFVHGRIFAGQLVSGGAYSDTVTVTVDF